LGLHPVVSLSLSLKLVLSKNMHLIHILIKH
jgi:hypothetical protein